MDELTFLVNGSDGATPLQAYCSVKTPHFMFVDSVYPYRNISICVGITGADNEFGDNSYTRKTVILELKKLRGTIHGVKHFYDPYKAVLRIFSEFEAKEYDRYNKQQFKSGEENARYLHRMHKRLKCIYLHHLERAIPEVPFSNMPDKVIPPYLLEQILNYLDTLKR